ncbi:MAG: thioredoxin domain-containing protein [Kurthia sp.]|nr:thioredoxin domain-containing protein [Candidatus Kurthia equi]
MSQHSNQNQLIHETSPYLLQHAHNPVNWYPWGDEAFQLATQQNKPIFVSIGYSTCHWCHRMAHDCFEDAEVAAILNRDFISVKVDREERPDIDQIYMNVCQMLTGAGGWPLHVFLTPQQLPFYAATYIPKYSSDKQAGMLDILSYLKDVYDNQPDRVQQIGRGLQQGLISQSTATIVQRTEGIIDQAFSMLDQQFDWQYGGFGGAPKFPNVPQLQFLLKYGELREEEHAFHLVEKTLDQLYKGGIYDHIGGGFARYSTDSRWLVPHFEKMLYDQALLLMAYAEGYQKLKKPIYKHVIEDMFQFLLREMKGVNGSYYSAIDADSEGREGAYYLWDVADVPPQLAKAYGVFGTPHLDGQYVLNLINHPSFEQAAQENQQQREQLLQLRQTRSYPHVDKKQLTGWNALLVAAFAKAGAAIQNDAIIQEAVQLMSIMEKEHMLDYRLKMTLDSKAHAYLDDYSYMLWAYNELHRTTQDTAYLEKAKCLTKYINQHFLHEKGGFTTSSTMHEQLIVNQKPILDAALPAGNAVLALEFYRLSRMTHDVQLEKLALDQLEVFSYDVMNYPTAALTLLQLEVELQADGKEYEFSGQAQHLVQILQQQYRPFDNWSTKIAEQFSLQICQRYSCLRSIHSEEIARKKILENN